MHYLMTSAHRRGPALQMPALSADAAAVLQETGWTEGAVKRALGIAADVLYGADAAHRVQAEINASVGHAERSVFVRFALRAQPGLASELSWKLADALVAEGLDRPGLVLAFVTAAPARQAA